MAKNTIKLKDHVLVTVQVEHVTAEAITPGYICSVTTAGLMQKHSNAGGNVAPLYVALEDELQGDDIDTDIASGERGQFWIPRSGDEFYAYLKNGEDVAIGAKLESAGTGELQEYVADEVDSASPAGTFYPNQIVAEALEAVDLSASATESHQRIKVRVV